MKWLDRFLAQIYTRQRRAFKTVKEASFRKNFELDRSLKFGDIENISLVGNVSIGQNSYLNSGRLVTGENSKITIGDNCEIGYNVNIIAITHDSEFSTGPDKKAVEADVTIGNNVWIGSNVFIKEGISIGDNSIIGANSVVVKDVSENEIVGGIPAKTIKFKSEKK